MNGRLTVTITIILLLIALVVITYLYGNNVKYTNYDLLIREGDINKYKVKAGEVCDKKEVCPDDYYCSGVCVKGPSGSLGNFCPCNEGLSCSYNPNGWTCLYPPGSSCIKDADCSSNYCQEGKCALKAPNGYACQYDGQCSSNNCSFSFCQPSGVTSGLENALCFNDYPDPRVKIGDKPGCSSLLDCVEGKCLRQEHPFASTCTSQCNSPFVCSCTSSVCHCQLPGNTTCDAKTPCNEYFQCSNGKCLVPKSGACMANSDCLSNNCQSSNSYLYFDGNNFINLQGNGMVVNYDRLLISNLSKPIYNVPISTMCLHQVGERNYFSPLTSNLNFNTTNVVLPLIFPYLFYDGNPSPVSVLGNLSFYVIASGPSLYSIIQLNSTSVVDIDIDADKNVVAQGTDGNFYITNITGISGRKEYINTNVKGSKPRLCSNEKLGSGSGKVTFSFLRDGVVQFCQYIRPSSSTFTVNELKYSYGKEITDHAFIDEANGLIAYKDVDDSYKVSFIIKGISFPVQGKFSSNVKVSCVANPYNSTEDIRAVIGDTSSCA